jgi:hypothetical protein
MKNLIKKISLVFVTYFFTYLASAQNYELRIVNNTGCSIFVTVLNTIPTPPVSIFSANCGPGTTSTCVPVTNQPTQVDFTEVGQTCIVQMTSLPGNTSCGATCTCNCLNTSRTFDVSYYSTGGICSTLTPFLWEITIN